MDKKKLILICSLAAVLVIVIILIFALRGCGKKDKDTDTSGSDTVTIATDSDGNTIVPPENSSDDPSAATSVPGESTEPGATSVSGETTIPGQSGSDSSSATDPSSTDGTSKDPAGNDPTLFLNGLNELLSADGKSKLAGHRQEVEGIVRDIFSQGTGNDAGLRMTAVFKLLQAKFSIEVPAVMSGFQSSQERLTVAMESMLRTMTSAEMARAVSFVA